MQEFKLPDLGEGMHEAEIRRWLVKVGDTVKLDQLMLEVETDKAVVEIPAPFAGRVADIRVPEGKVAQLGEVLVTFDTGTATSTPVAASTVASAQASASAATVTGTAAHPRVLATPGVRKRAFELGIELEQVPPSHPSGRVTMEDVEAYVQHATTVAPAATPTPEPFATPSVAVAARSNGSSTAVVAERKEAPSVPTATTEERQALTGLRRRIAERMEHAWRTIPHAVAFSDVDGTELVALRQALKPVAQQRGVRLTYIPLLIKLLLPVLKEYPVFNASFDEEKREIVYKRSYHIGIATDTPEGLLVPVIRDADKLTVIEIAQRLEHLVEGAQKRTLTLQEVTGSTFTLNNIGAFGGSSGVPIINYPEAAILAVGRLQEKPIIYNGAITARPMLPLTLSFDHRLIDGGMSGKFLERFKELVEHPQQLWLDMV